jgi:hypothetical protein
MPMRDAFAVLFFVSVGMLLDPAQLLQQPMRVLLTLAVVLIGKPAAALAIAALFRQMLIGDEPWRVGPNQQPGEEIPDDGRESEAMRQIARRQRRRETAGESHDQIEGVH